MTQQSETQSVTVILPAGRLPLDLMQKAQELASEHNLGIYLSTMQNLRILNVPKDKLDEIKKPLAALGATFKKPGTFPIPRICVGKPHCNLGVIDSFALSDSILDHFKERTTLKPKIKIGLSACILCCSGAKLSDIGVVATRNGLDVYAGGKGGPAPKTGIRIAQNLDETELMKTITTLLDYHEKKTGKKQRLYKLLKEPDFPFSEL